MLSMTRSSRYLYTFRKLFLQEPAHQFVTNSVSVALLPAACRLILSMNLRRFFLPQGRPAGMQS